MGNIFIKKSSENQMYAASPAGKGSFFSDETVRNAFRDETNSKISTSFSMPYSYKALRTKPLMNTLVIG